MFVNEHSKQHFSAISSGAPWQTKHGHSDSKIHPYQAYKMAASRNNFNLLRFIFAGLVIISHAPELKDGNRSNEWLTQAFGTLSFGELAVDSFFIISGYLITKSWIGKPHLTSYLRSRILRIYPGYLVASILCAFLLGPLVGSSEYFSEFNTVKYLKSAALLKMPAIPAVFANTPYPLVNGAMGTIFYEFLCYLFVAFLGLLGIYKKREFVIVLSVALALLFVLHKGQWLELGRAETYVRLGMIFMFGSSFYLYDNAIRWTSRYALLATLAATILLYNSALAEVSVGVLWGYSILYFANHAKEFRPFNLLPDISYGLYLYAWPVTKLLYWYWPETSIMACIIYTYVISIALGTASWVIVEKPFMKLKYAAQVKFSF